MIANLKTIASPMLHNDCAILCLATAGLAPCLQAACSIFASSVQQTRQTPRSATCAQIVFVRLVQPYPDTLQHIGGACTAYLKALCSTSAKRVQHTCRPLQHACKPCAAYVQALCSKLAGSVQHICSLRAAYLQALCNRCAGPVQHICRPCATYL